MTRSANHAPCRAGVHSPVSRSLFSVRFTCGFAIVRLSKVGGDVPSPVGREAHHRRRPEPPSSRYAGDTPGTASPSWRGQPELFTLGAGGRHRDRSVLAGRVSSVVPTLGRCLYSADTASTAHTANPRKSFILFGLSW